MDDESGTRNEQSGTVNGPIAQVGAVHGDIHFGERTQDPVVPWQLPPAVGSFAGQADELAALNAVLDDSARVVVVSAVEGVTGIGKTALAVHWANQVAEQFPDGQLYVNLRGSDPSGWPVRPGDVLRGFLEALGDTKIPSDVAARAARYRTLLATKRVLVVLDDAEDVEQVRLLLPGGSTSFVVVTSRGQLTGLIAEGARSLTLDALSASEARELLAHYLGNDRLAAEREAADELIVLCAGLPHALSVVAAHAADVPLATLAGELRNEIGSPEVGNLSSRMATVLAWSHGRSQPPPVDRDWRSRVGKLAWLSSPKVLFAAAVAVAVTMLAASTEMIVASSFLGFGYFVLRLALLFGGLVLMERSGARGVIGSGLAVASAVYVLVDALATIHSVADVWGWLEFFAVILFGVVFAMRLAPFRDVPRPERIVPPTRRPLAYVVLGAAAVQFILLFAAIPTEYGSTTIMAGVGALGALLPVVAIGGLCVAAVLADGGDEAQRTFVTSVVMAYVAPELLLMLGSLLLGPQFTYLGSGFWGTGSTSAAWVFFVLAQAVSAAALMTSTTVLLRRAAESS
ncbi:NB-ARC domain-containing protein [Saccharopolyspora sp. K220]|uniref:NB-ARC domain-containing protein n=1 Tax=Saccharopolyspora soli TaxID=2926618 RepID=UPI001F5646D9|nr:NB-ARC domain-containing protein [Saccharopolyspora soli]MCI2417889.1 NB-ARC domain-containing protein [Saccharopolyspora soli]